MATNRPKSLECRSGDRGDASNRAGRTSVSSVKSRGMPSSIRSTCPEAAAPGGELSGAGRTKR